MSTLPCYKLLQLKILGIQGSDNFELVSGAVRNLAKEELGAILATTELNDAQKLKILTDRGLVEGELQAAYSTATYSATNVTATATTDALTASTGALGASLKGLWTTIKTHPIVAILAGIAISAKLLYDHLNFEARLEKLTEVSEELAETKSEIESLNSELSTAEERLNELESKGNLSFVEEEELNKLRQTNAELKSQLANLEAIEKVESAEVLDKFVSTVNSIEKSAAFGGNQVDDLDTYAKLRQAALEYEQTKDINTDGLNSTSIKEQEKKAEEAERKYKELLARYSFAYQEDYGVIETSSGWQYQIDSLFDIYKKQYEKYQETIDKLEGTDYSLLNDKQKEAYNRARENQWKIALTYSDEYGGLENVYQMIYNDRMFSEARDEIDELINEDELTVDALDELINSNEKVKELFTKMGISMTQGGLESFIAWFDKSDDSDDSVVSKVEQIREKFEDLTKELDTLQSTYNTVQSAIKDYNENGYLSIDNYQKMLELGDGYLSLLIDENGQLNLNEEAYKRVMKAKLEELTLNRVSTLLENILNMKQEEAQAYANAEANYAEADSLMELVKAEYEVAMMKATAKDQELGGDTYRKAIGRSITETGAWISMMESAIGGLGQYESQIDNVTDALKKQNEEMENAKSDIQDLIDLVIDMIKQEKESEKEVFEEKRDHINDLIDKQKELLQAKKEEAEFEKDLAEKQNSVAQNALASSLAELDDSSAGKKRQKETSDNLVESRDDLNSFLSDKEYDIRTKALEEQQEANDDYFNGLIEAVDEYLDDERKLYEDACRIIDDDNGTLYGRLYGYIYNYTTMSKGEFDGLWSSAKKALIKYDDAHTPLFETMSNLDLAIGTTSLQIESVSTSVSENLTESIKGAKKALGEYEKMISDIFHGYVFYIDGKAFVSLEADRDLAAWDIQSRLAAKGYNIPTGAVLGGLKAYASGTLSATGGISMVGENGAELRILNQGDGIIPADITKNLMSIGVNPTEFFNNMANEIIWRGFSDNSGLDSILKNVSVEIKPNISTPISISIAGNATQETVDALKKLTPQIANEAAKKVMETALRYSNVPRKY